MSTTQHTKYGKEIDRLTKYFSDAKGEPLLSKRMSEDPLEVLQSMGIAVEDEFKEVVTSQLRAAVDLIPREREMVPMSAEAKLMSAEAKSITVRPAAPTGLRVVQETMPPKAVQNALEASLRPWGLVLVVREPAIKFLQGGGTISASVLGGIAGIAGLGGLAAAASVLSTLGILVGAIVGIWAAALGIYSSVISLVDQGKGVYLTWTWAQLIPFLPSYGLPVVTPIK